MTTPEFAIPDLTDDEAAAFVAAAEARDDNTGKAQRLDEEVHNCAVVLGYTGHHARAQALLDAWEAFDGLLEDRCTCPSNEACVPCGLPSVPEVSS